MTIKNLLTVFGLLVLVSSCSSKQVREEKYDNGNPKKKYEVEEKKDGSFFKDGYYKVWFENGQISLLGAYKDNQQTGKWTSYYNTGKVREEGVYDNGQKSGGWKSYAENGQILGELNYKAGELDGLQKAWYLNGQKKSEQQYTNGKPNGTLSFWNDVGKLISTYNFEYGSNVSIVGDWNVMWIEDTANTTTGNNLIWSFTKDGIAKRRYSDAPENSAWTSPYQIVNCSIDSDLTNAMIEVEKGLNNFRILAINSNEMRLQDDGTSDVRVLKKLK